MKVLMVGFDLDRGGVGSVEMQLYRSLTRSGVQCDLTYFTGMEPSDSIREEIRRNGTNLWEMKNFKTAGFFGYIKQIRRICKSEKYDVIHIHTSLLIWVAALAAQLEGVKVRVGHAHGAKFLHYPTWVLMIIEPMGRVLNRLLCTDFVACSEASALYTFGRKAEFIPNYVEKEKLLQVQPQQAAELRRRLNAEDCPYVFVYLGSLDAGKRAEFLIDVAACLSRRGVNACIWLAGGTEHEEQFKNKIVALQMENHIKLLGFRRDNHELTQAADYYITASESEGMSVSLVEAQMAGKPCFASTLLPPENDLKIGLFTKIEGYNPDEWAAKIEQSIVEGVKPIEREESIRMVDVGSCGERAAIEKLLHIYCANKH